MTDTINQITADKIATIIKKTQQAHLLQHKQSHQHVSAEQDTQVLEIQRQILVKNQLNTSTSALKHETQLIWITPNRSSFER